MDGSSQRKLLKWKGWFITLCNSRAIFFFFALLSHFSRLWLFSRAASLSPTGLQAKRFHHLNMLSLKTRGPMLFLKAALFWHSSSFGWGKNPCLKLKAGDAVNILHQSPENASQTNVPYRAFSLFISVRGVFSSTLVQWWLPNQLNVLLPIHFRECTVLSLMDCVVGHH